MHGNVDYTLIGSRIKEARRQKGLTQERLAEALGVSVGYISQVERGITRISLDLLGAVSGLLGKDVSWFVDRSGVRSEHYLVEEFEREYLTLEAADKKLVLEMIRLLKNREL